MRGKQSVKEGIWYFGRKNRKIRPRIKKKTARKGISNRFTSVRFTNIAITSAK